MRALALALALILSGMAGGPDAAALEAQARSIEVRSSPITNFRRGSGETRFGALEFVGGFEMRSSASEFGQLSSMRFLTPGGDFVGVADHGYWFFGTIERDGHVPVGISGFRMQPMVDENGVVVTEKRRNDAEGLDVHGDRATVAFEREARVSEYRLGAKGAGPPLRNLDFVIPRRELRFNQGIETLARAPDDSPLKSARVVVAERSIDENGDIFAAIIEGAHKGVFKVKRSEDFDVTDGVFLPNGDLLLLERRYRPPFSVGMRLRRIDGDMVRPGSLADGKVLIEADLSSRIDNMEALDVWRREDGKLIVSLLSDDNQNFLQSTLYLEFVLVEE